MLRFEPVNQQNLYSIILGAGTPSSPNELGRTNCFIGDEGISAPSPLSYLSAESDQSVFKDNQFIIDQFIIASVSRE